MAAKDYTQSRATATRLLEKFGASAVIVSMEAGDGPAWDPGAPTETENAVTAAVVEYSAFERNGTSVEAGDKKALVTAGVIAPDTSMIFRWQGVDHQIVRVMPISPAGVDVVFEMQVRKAA